MDAILAIDQGTTSSRAIIFDSNLNAVITKAREFPQHFPADGWVEHDPEDIWQSVLSVCRSALKDAKKSGYDVKAIGITNQRETCMIWHRVTGKAVHHAIVWQDRRTAPMCEDLKGKGLEPLFTEKTGLILDSYFSGTKAAWLLNNVDNLRGKAEGGDLAFGTVDTWLIWKLTGGKSHVTDATNASRTLMFNIHKQDWDQELLDILNVPRALLPEVKNCAADFGTSEKSLLDIALPIYGVAGDQQAALIGQGAFDVGDIKSTYGTGCFLLVNSGQDAVTSSNRLLTTVGYRLEGQTTYALEGSIFIAGAGVQWLRDSLKLIESSAETAVIAGRAKKDHNVYFVPALTGLGAPHWDAEARGTITGLTRDAGRAELVDATLRAAAYQTQDILEAVAADGVEVRRIRVDGGMANNAVFCQALSDICDLPIDKPESSEQTARGAAALAALQAGILKSLNDIKDTNKLDAQYEPKMPLDMRDKKLAGWKAAVKRTLTTLARP